MNQPRKKVRTHLTDAAPKKRGHRGQRRAGGDEKKKTHRSERKREKERPFPLGRITVTRKGFAFVSLEANQEGFGELPEADVFVPAQSVNNALTGDLIKIRITDLYNTKGPVGQVVEVVERHRTAFVGQVVEAQTRSSRVIIKPISTAFTRTLAAKAIIDVEIGDWVEFTIERTTDDQGFNIDLIRRVETQNSVSGILDSLAAEFELPLPYTTEEEERAGALPLQEIERRDLTDLVTMTIDPIDAKDFDDALSIVAEDEKTITIGIHIADVAAYIPPGSYFDEKSASRCFTNYLPGRMIPMLPRTLLKERCSLNAGELKPAHSVFVKLSKTSGEVKDYERFHSWINVNKRMHYEEVQQYLDSQKLTFHDATPSLFEYKSGLSYDESFETTYQDWPEEVLKSITKLFATYKMVRTRRKALEHYVDVSPKEIRVMCSSNPPEIKGLRHEKSDEAHEIVEEFMLMANTLVAEETFHAQIPAIYRIHPAPSPDSLLNFSRWLNETLQVKAGSLKHRKDINKLLRSFDRNDPYFDVIMVSFVKTMERAKYESVCQPHYGLGKEKYLHFTSPIRRYTDLFVHQQLWAGDTGDYKAKDSAHATSVASVITNTEKRYDEAYWAANDRMKLQFIADRVASGEKVQLEAVIMNFTKSEISLYLPEIGSFGSIPFNALDGYYAVSDDGLKIMGKRKGARVFTKGEILYVGIKNVDPLMAKLEYVPICNPDSEENETESDK